MEDQRTGEDLGHTLAIFSLLRFSGPPCKLLLFPFLFLLSGPRYQAQWSACEQGANPYRAPPTQNLPGILDPYVETVYRC